MTTTESNTQFTMGGRTKPTLPHALVRKDIKIRELDMLVIEEGSHLSREAASWVAGIALHEQHDFALLHQPLHSLLQLLRSLSLLRNVRRKVDARRWSGVLVRPGQRVEGGAGSVLLHRFGELIGVGAVYTVKQHMSLFEGIKGTNWQASEVRHLP